MDHSSLLQVLHSTKSTCFIYNSSSETQAHIFMDHFLVLLLLQLPSLLQVCTILHLTYFIHISLLPTFLTITSSFHHNPIHLPFCSTTLLFIPVCLFQMIGTSSPHHITSLKKKREGSIATYFMTFLIHWFITSFLSRI